MRHANILLSLISLCLLALQPGSATSSSDNNSGPGVALTRQAIALGMEPTTLSELWRTKQPVIVSKIDALGKELSTTYELSPDGQQITSSSHKVEQVNPPSQPAAVVQQPTNPQSDWEYVPRSPNKLSSSSTFGNNWPNFGSPTWPSFSFPSSGIPQTSTGDQGRTVTTTTRVFRGPVNSIWSNGADVAAKWPNFNYPAGVTPRTTTKTTLDDQGRTVTTVTKTYPVISTVSSGTDPDGLPTNWNDFNGLPSWFKTPNFENESPSLTPTPAAQPVPLPVPLPTRPTVLSQPPLPTAVPSYDMYTTTPLPSLEEFLRQTPKTTDTTNVYEPTVNRTRITRVNFNSAARPTIADMDPQMRDMLSRGGITDEDLQTARVQGNDLVRTVALPDGRSITTTVRIKNRAEPQPVVPLPTAPPRQAPPPVQPQGNTIDDYLSQVQLTPSDIQAQNGEVIKTLVDQNGRVLSVKFVLSTVKGDEQGQGQTEQSNK
ncbi:probable serine/threonine-protein kinase roco5 [Drosophila grimshawi]|uniref:GH10599 n=1 Tax=Drosophila grimshawi TaxID=7222 RepID=B4JD79_DROGR|nr:probable serine/threonine-protein kinase roco5 [Drosophila grimshawi]EDW03252.1 GH10599 [Drosophila grimshawi]